MISLPAIPSLTAEPSWARPPSLRENAMGKRLSALATGRTGPGESPLTFTSAMQRRGKTREERATEAAQELVAVALVQPTLKALREANHAAPPFAPGDAERRFGSLLDAEQSKRIAGSSNFPLVDALRDRMLGVYSPPAPIAARGAFGRDLAPFTAEQVRSLHSRRAQTEEATGG